MSRFRVVLVLGTAFVLFLVISIIPISSVDNQSFSSQSLETVWIGADGSPYIPTERMYPEDIVFPSSYYDYVLTSFDSNGYPHYLYYKYNKCLYSRWDGSQWVNVEGEPINNHSSRIKLPFCSYTIMETFFCLDSSNYPHYSCYDCYARFNGSNWVSASNEFDDSDDEIYIVEEGNYKQLILIDSNDSPIIVSNNWYSDKDDIFFFYWDGSKWDTKCRLQITNNCFIYHSDFSVCLDSNDNIHVAWSKTDNDLECESMAIKYIRYSKWNGKEWITVDGEIYDENTDNSIVVSSSTSIYDYKLVLDSFDNPHLCWIDIRDYDNDKPKYSMLSYIKWSDNSWVTADGSLYYTDTSNSNFSGFDNNIESFDISLDSNNNPHIAFESADPNSNDVDDDYDIYYIHWYDDKWVSVDNIPYVSCRNASNVSRNYNSSRPVLFLDKYDNPHLSWLSKYENRYLFYVTSVAKDPVVQN